MDFAIKKRKEVTMKKAISLVMAGVFVLFVFFLTPVLSQAGGDANGCYDNHEQCTERAYSANVGWIKTALMLTVCDVALGACLIRGTK
jgi:uncharacterized membrane protein YidH (DUF202 family)